MLKPKIIQLPDYSEYIGKEFIITEDADMKNTTLDYPMLKGVRFIIKKIKNTKITLKISNSKLELKELGMLNYDFNRLINNIEKDIKILKKVYNMWEVDSDKFVISGSVHCINTGYYGIPGDHPDKYGTAKAYIDDDGKEYISDSIMTSDYKRTDNKTNVYSYQSGRNVFYSKKCYGFMIKGKEVELEKLKNRNIYYEKMIFGWILEKKEIYVKTLNKINFELYK